MIQSDELQSAACKLHGVKHQSVQSSCIFAVGVRKFLYVAPYVTVPWKERLARLVEHHKGGDGSALVNEEFLQCQIGAEMIADPIHSTADFAAIHVSRPCRGIGNNGQ